MARQHARWAAALTGIALALLSGQAWTDRLGQASSQPSRPRGVLRLSADGWIGAWNVAGPYPSLNSLDLAHQKPDTPTAPRGLVWKWLGNPEGDIDLIEGLSLPASGSQAAVLSGGLALVRDFDGWFLLASDGLAQVAIDGKIVARRNTPRQRRNGWDAIPMQLEKGWHEVWVGVERRGTRLGFRARWVERATGHAPLDASWQLATPLSPDNQLGSLLSVSLGFDTSRATPALLVEIKAAASMPEGRFPVRLLLSTSEGVYAQYPAGIWNVEERGLRNFDIRLAPLERAIPRDKPCYLTVKIGEHEKRLPLGTLLSHLELLHAADRFLGPALRSPTVPSSPNVEKATLRLLADRLSASLAADRSPQALEAEARKLERLLHSLIEHEPVFQEPGIHEVGIPSPYDSRPQSALLQVPRSYDPNATTDRRWPLTVVLHGYQSNPNRALHAFLDRPPSDPSPRVDGFILAPAAHGNSFYRGAGEAAVLQALDWAIDSYPIDRDRISITGASMGGTGTAEIAFHHADRFSAAAPLCGYHSYFVRRDTANQPIRDWERWLMQSASTTNWADNGIHLPLYVAHGTKDLPLTNSRVLTDRYRALGYRLSEEWPEIGHSVWTISYAEAKMWAWLTRWKRNPEPRRVVVTSPSYRYARQYWVEISGLSQPGEFGRVDASITGSQKVEAKTRGVSELTLGPTQLLEPSQPLEIRIDSDQLTLAPHSDWRLHRIDGHWEPGGLLRKPNHRQRGLEGPFAELFNQPLLVVYGSGIPANTPLNRAVASALVAPALGVDLQIPIISDRDFEPTEFPGFRALYVGSPDDNCWLGKMRRLLPIRVHAGELSAGDTCYGGRSVGAMYVYPDPLRPGELMGVVTAPRPEGLFYALSLPSLVPDYIIFDQRVAAAEGRTILGTNADVLAAGFFNDAWQLPMGAVSPSAALVDEGPSSHESGEALERTRIHPCSEK